MIGKSMSLQKSSKSQQNVCVVRPWECFSLNLQNFVHLISALSSFLSVEEDRKKRYNFESQDTTSYPSILGWRRISIAGSVPCWLSCHMPLGYIWKKPLYPRAFTTGDTCLVVTLKFYMSRYIASSLLNQIQKSLPKYMLGSDSVVSDWADRDEDNTSQQEPDPMEWHEEHTMRDARK